MEPVNVKLRAWELLDDDPTLDVDELVRKAECPRTMARRYLTLWNKGMLAPQKLPRLAKVDHYPLLTSVGIAHGPPVAAPTWAPPGKDICDVCPEHRECNTDVARGDFAHCEAVLASEVL